MNHAPSRILDSLRRFRCDVVTCNEEDLVGSVATNMRDNRVGCVVVTRRERPIGILTDRDLAVRVLAEGLDARTTRVRDVVAYGAYVALESDGIESAIALMREHGVRRIPIVDDNGFVKGIVTVDELVAVLGRNLADLCREIDNQSDTTESR